MPKWTKEQELAIKEKGNNLLVAAAAGSGKTAVLVERIIHKIIDDKVDIDKILVVTFTNAAASEMRERILDAIYKKIEENPNDVHLQKQIVLLNKANICTIHSFCLNIIRNYFYELNISANFKIGDSAEMEILKQEVLEDLFEEKYEKKDKDFLMLIDNYASYRGDDSLKEIILKIENQIQSNPFPKLWLEEKTEMFNLKDKLNVDFSNTIWGKIILNEICSKLKENSLKLESLIKNIHRYDELYKYEEVICKDKEIVDKFINIIKSDDSFIWEKLYNQIQNLEFETWPRDSKITILYKDEAKVLRDKIKKNVLSCVKDISLFNSEEANKTLYQMYDKLLAIKNIIFEFEERFSEKKKEKNKIDFHDIEHLALKILTREDNGKIIPSNIANEIRNSFVEIAIDEYQDSNLVQEYILTSISNGNNVFMVGDMKQSIYRFRQARVELFLDKYEKYATVDDKEKSIGKKIQLFKNFRSRKEVLDFCNYIFENIMSKELGNVDYNKEEYLNLGAEYEEDINNQFMPELHILDLNKKEDLNEESFESDIEQETDIKSQRNEIFEKNEQEAKIVACRIEELINENYLVNDKKDGLRKLKYKDIAILLRTTSEIAQIYEKELSKRNIPVYCDTSSNYLETNEIQTIMALLKVINNPKQDIPLVCVLRSPIGDFTDNELIEIRLNDKNNSFYESMLKARISVDERLRNKINMFLTNLENWKEAEKEKTLDELIWQIYEESNFYNYVGLLNNGNIKQANLKMLFERAKQYETASFKGLYNFINFIDRVKISSGDMSSAKIVGENDDVVRIMSIHKSKGLEFPVVFLSGTGKQFNKKDLTDNIILHQDYGLGPKYIDDKNKISFSTLAKTALKIELEKEMISEEMRVLYVALTRAREKLIITGSMKNYDVEIKKLEEMISIYNQKQNEKVNTLLLTKYTSYLNWILLLKLKNNNQNLINIKVHKLEDNNIEKNINDKIEFEKENNYSFSKEELKKFDNIKNELEWKYKYGSSINIPTKTSVSRIKEEMQKELALEEITNKKLEHKYNVPKFMLEHEENISSAKKGSLIHLCFEKLDNKKDYSREDIEELIKGLVDKEIIFKEEAEAINIDIIMNFINSDLNKELKNSKEIYKETPFYIEVSADRLSSEFDKNEKIMVQGIIDLYYINSNNELILVDYKTDYIKNGEEEKLIRRYKEQLDLYKEALEKSLDRKVDKVYIYSTYLGKIEL